MKKIMFRLSPGEREGQETEDVKLKKYEEYKKLLIEGGEIIIKEELGQDKRFGKVMIIYCE